MEKLVYLCWKRAGDSMERFRDALVGDVSPRLLDGGALSLTINVADLGDCVQDSPLIIGEGKTIAASVSLWLHSIDGRGVIEETLATLAERVWGYLVTESVPLQYADRNWPDGAKSPGV